MNSTESKTIQSVFACVLIGGKSSRMGRPKHLLRQAGCFWLERTVTITAALVDEVVLVGAGTIPPSLNHLTRLSDAVGPKGPLAGILAALRWRPDVSWLVLACDLPALQPEALQWLLREAQQGGLAILPCLDKGEGLQRVEPLLAFYSGQCLPYLEELAASGNWRMNQLRHVQGVRTPLPPPEFQLAWRNINTPQQLMRYLDETEGKTTAKAATVLHEETG
ncbi:MAG: molybdenum cofactor guanylyltransferase [Desulfobulbus sp.]